MRSKVVMTAKKDEGASTLEINVMGETMRLGSPNAAAKVGVGEIRQQCVAHTNLSGVGGKPCIVERPIPPHAPGIVLKSAWHPAHTMRFRYTLTQ